MCRSILGSLPDQRLVHRLGEVVGCSQMLAICGVVIAVFGIFLPYVAHLNRIAAVNRVLLLQFPQQLLTGPTTPPEILAAMKV